MLRRRFEFEIAVTTILRVAWLLLLHGRCIGAGVGPIALKIATRASSVARPRSALVVERVWVGADNEGAYLVASYNR
jgi:hypothetical protein